MAMSLLVRIGVPAAAGALTFFAQWGVLSSKRTPQVVTTVRRMMKPGEVFEAAALDEADMLGEPDRLRVTFVPAADREVIVGAVCQRELHPGDPVLWRDVRRASTGIEPGPGEHVLPVDLAGVSVETAMLFANDMISFWVGPPPHDGPAGGPLGTAVSAPARPVREESPIIGPFRVLSVGTDTSLGPEPAEGGGEGSRRRGNERVVCVAVRIGPDGKYDTSARRLIEAISGRRLLALTVSPAGRATPAGARP